MAAQIKVLPGMELGHGPGDFVLDGDPAPPSPKGGAAEPPKFSAHVYCGQTAGWMKLVLGMEAGLSPGDFVLDGIQPLPKRVRSRPQFSAHVYCGQTAAWIKMPLGTEVGLGPDDIVLDGNPAPPPPKGTEPIPNFLLMSVVAKQLDGSSSLLFQCDMHTLLQDTYKYRKYNTNKIQVKYSTQSTHGTKQTK